MMAADYDITSRPPLVSSHGNAKSGANLDRPHQRGKGKGFGKGRNEFPSRIRDFVFPEMFSDPWLDLYSNLPDDIRSRETVHLSDSEKLRVEAGVKSESVAKRFYTS